MTLCTSNEFLYNEMVVHNLHRKDAHSDLSLADAAQPEPEADSDRDEDVVDLVNNSFVGLDVCLDDIGFVHLHSTASDCNSEPVLMAVIRLLGIPGCTDR